MYICLTYMLMLPRSIISYHSLFLVDLCYFVHVDGVVPAVCGCAHVHLYVPVCTCTYVPVRTCMYVPVCTCTFLYVPVCTYLYVPVRTCTAVCAALK